MKFTHSSDFDGNVCKCGVAYWRRFERGRRMIDMLRPGDKQERLRCVNLSHLTISPFISTILTEMPQKVVQ